MNQDGWIRVFIIRGDGYWPVGSEQEKELCQLGATLADKSRFSLLQRNPILIYPHPHTDRGTWTAAEKIADAFTEQSGVMFKKYHNVPLTADFLSGDKATAVHKHMEGARWCQEWAPFFSDNPYFRENAILNASTIWDEALGIIKHVGDDSGAAVLVTNGLVMPPLLARVLHDSNVDDDWIEPLDVRSVWVGPGNFRWDTKNDVDLGRLAANRE